MRNGALLISLLLISGCGPAERTGPRQVVLITIDTLRADALGCYGGPVGASPRIDSFARGARLYEDVSCQAPWTTASFASLMTGRYASEALGSHQVVHPDLPTMAELLRADGITTAAVVSNPRVRRELGFHRGFEHYVELFRPGVDPAEPVGAGEVPDGPDRRGKVLGGQVTTAVAALLPDLRERDFFLWVLYLDPHTPYFRHSDRFYRGESPIPLEAEVGGRVRVQPSAGTELPDPEDGFGQGIAPEGPRSPATLPLIRYLYEGEIRYVDDQVGRLLDDLESTGLLDQAMVIVTSDHGESLFDHEGYYGHGRLPYQPTVHVPLMVLAPGVRPGRDRHPAALLDLPPSILKHCGLTVPETWRGRPLGSRFRGRDPILVETVGWTHRAIRQGPLKLIRWGEDRVPTVSLHHLSTDPGETTNRAVGRAGMTERLGRKLERAVESLIPAPRDLPQPVMELAVQEQLQALGYVE